MPSIEYHYPRALELEGRHPNDVGIWPITVSRIAKGEGLPLPGTPEYVVDFDDGAPIPHSKRPIHVIRSIYYRRIRSSAKCSHALILNPQIRASAALQMTQHWASPPLGGAIPVPSESDVILPMSHSVMILSSNPNDRRFRFRLKWPTWGEQGYGSLPFEYFDRYVFACWTDYVFSESLRQYKEVRSDKTPGHFNWTARDELDTRIYGFEIRDPNSNEPLAWTFGQEISKAIEVEEFYVRPEHRGKGYGNWLAQSIKQVAIAQKMPVRLWIDFADCKHEDEENYPRLSAIARRLGVQFQECTVPWAAYFATNETAGADCPIEPTFIPIRPRTPLNEVLAFVAGLGIAAGTAMIEPLPNGHSSKAVVSSIREIEVGSIEWDRLTERRSELIYKLHREGLTSEEQVEFENLQNQSRTAINRRFPANLDSLKQKLPSFGVAEDSSKT